MAKYEWDIDVEGDVEFEVEGYDSYYYYFYVNKAKLLKMIERIEEWEQENSVKPQSLPNKDASP